MAAPDARLEAALRQPGAVQRDGYVKFACPACEAEGHDRQQDNAAFCALDNFDDGASDQPALDAGDANLPRLADAAWKALIAANDPPRLFRHGGHLVRLVKGEEEHP